MNPGVAMSPLERGRRKYQQKEYQAALAPFTEVLLFNIHGTRFIMPVT